jgi:hypothetical protein
MGDEACSDCGEQPGAIRCLDCFGRRLLCKDCVVISHRHLPFHRIEAWNGNCFLPSSLVDQGFILHVGHGGEPCPNAHRDAEWVDMDQGDDSAMDETIDVGPNADHKTSLLIVDTAGIFNHHVAWCRCVPDNKPDQAMVLFQHHLFPSSFIRPETAFTFNVLDDFYMESMECKTAAMSFYQKLRRLTSNTFPGNVAVSDFITSISVVLLK